ncbi:hypothetical protein [Sphingomonas sp. PP-CE-1G-424]|nr:hypothetical protein [Sphingomonas sp. PP-CE-1G-424]TCP65856.1 hypothetical protein C8J43_10860 [Sphingomonas sp. PP-CE-1G-424]
MNVSNDQADFDGHDQLAALLATNRNPPIGDYGPACSRGACR